MPIYPTSIQHTFHYGYVAPYLEDIQLVIDTARLGQELSLYWWRKKVNYWPFFSFFQHLRSITVTIGHWQGDDYIISPWQRIVPKPRCPWSVVRLLHIAVLTVDDDHPPFIARLNCDVVSVILSYLCGYEAALELCADIDSIPRSVGDSIFFEIDTVH